MNYKHLGKPNGAAAQSLPSLGTLLVPPECQLEVNPQGPDRLAFRLREGAGGMGSRPKRTLPAMLLAIGCD
eukprot:2781567-Rhodomonas_salina.1